MEQKIVIVGTKFRGPDALAAMGMLTKGEVVALRAEPENPTDPGAIAVYRGAQHIGYVPKHAGTIRAAITDGLEISATVTSEPIMQDGQSVELPRLTVKWKDKTDAE